ncbi:hypothetical protein D3C84_1146860 [compost metagenome]
MQLIHLCHNLGIAKLPDVADEITVSLGHLFSLNDPHLCKLHPQVSFSDTRIPF